MEDSNNSKNSQKINKSPGLPAKLPNNILNWSIKDVEDWIITLGLIQYKNIFYEHNIDGSVLVNLNMQLLKEMGLTSVGNRLDLLNSLYDIKVKQNITFEPDDYIPQSVMNKNKIKRQKLFDVLSKSETNLVTLDQLLQGLSVRDVRLSGQEKDIRHLYENYARLREDMLPVFKKLKESKPLPTPDSEQHLKKNNSPSTLKSSSQYVSRYQPHSQSANNLSNHPLRETSTIEPSLMDNKPINNNSTFNRSISTEQIPKLSNTSFDKSNNKANFLSSSSSLSYKRGYSNATQKPSLNRHSMAFPPQTNDFPAFSSPLPLNNNSLVSPPPNYSPSSSVSSPNHNEPSSANGYHSSNSTSSLPSLNPNDLSSTSSTSSHSNDPNTLMPLSASSMTSFPNSTTTSPSTITFSKKKSISSSLPSSPGAINYDDPSVSPSPLVSPNSISSPNYSNINIINSNTQQSSHLTNYNSNIKSSYPSPSDPPNPSSTVSSSSSTGTGSVTAMKSFKLSENDPCYKVLPAALKRYKINGDWKSYALLVSCDGVERLLGLEEKPLRIFKELQDMGRKPVFMLRHIDGSNPDKGLTM